MKPQVDTSEPHVAHLDHLRNNLKREQLLEERYFEIDRENKILLQKMSDIMKHNSYASERGRSGPPSLNRDLRKMELMRITQENHSILKRIQKAQPIYNHVEWEDSYRRSETYLRNKCEFPVTPSTRGSMRSTTGASFRPMSKPATVDGEEFHASSARSSTRGGGSPHQTAVHQNTRSGEEPRYVLKEGKKIGATYYLIEMVTDGRDLAISAYDGEQQRTLELVVNEKNHRRLFREAEGDYNLVAERLRIEGDQLALDLDRQGFTGTGE
jgi:E3 ubiquitin-protein ligase TRIP12